MEEIVHKKGKIYYSMGEVSEMFDVNPSLIRFWEKKFNILKPHKNKKGNRMFTPQDVDNLKLIYHLVKERGMTLAGAQKVLKENKGGTMRDIEIADRLLAIKAMLVEIREELKAEGEVISPDGYLDEEEQDAAEPGIAGEATGESDTEDFVLISEEVRYEVVTDGSSPWTEDEPAEADESEEPVDETQRQAAMEELRSIKSILDGWDDIDQTAGDEQDDEPADTEVYEGMNISAVRQVDETTNADAANRPDDITADTAAKAVSETIAEDNHAAEAAGHTTTEADPAVKKCDSPEDQFETISDGEEYADPWEEIGEQQAEPDTFGAAPTADSRPLPGDLFGTDVCTTFSGDDREAMAAAEKKEEPKRPGIYEQTLF